MIIKGYDPVALLKRTMREVIRDDVLGRSAQAAYSFFFSLFPLLLFLAPLFGLIGKDREILNQILTRLQLAIPAEAYALLAGVIEDVVFSENAPGLISIGIVLAAFSGSAVLGTLSGALNHAHDVTDPRPFWKKRLISMAFAAVAMVVVVVASVVMVAGQSLIDLAVQFFGIGADTARVWAIVQYPIALSLLTGIIWLLFYFLPYVKQKKTHVLIGSIFTVLLWIAVTMLFRLYVTNFGSYNRTYGTIGGVIVLLLWMYLTMAAFLTGGELNSELRKGTGRVDTQPNRLPSDAIRDAAIAERSRF